MPTATYRATAFLQAAQLYGAELVLGSERSQAMAGAMGDRFVLLPLDQPEVAAGLIAEASARNRIDAVLSVDDQGSLTAALAAAALGLRHAGAAAVGVTRDKAAFRAALARAGVRQARFRVVPPVTTVDGAAEQPTGGSRGGTSPAGRFDRVVRAAEEIGFPVVLKPASLSASRGVIRADDAAGAQEAAARIANIVEEAEGSPGPMLVEEFLPGTEIALEGIVRGGSLDTLAIFDKPDPLDGPYFEETIYVTPSRLPAGTLAAARRLVAEALAAIGLDEGPIHAEVRVGPAGELHVIEVAARTIGGRCSRAVTAVLGTTLEALVIDHALGGRPGGARRPGGQPAARAAGVMMLPIPRSGVLAHVGGRELALAVPGISGIEVTVTEGQPIRALPEGDRYLGFLFADGETPGEVEESLRKAHALLDIDIR